MGTVSSIISEAIAELLKNSGGDNNERKYESFGFFLEDYVVQGGDLTVDAVNPHNFTVSEAVVSFQDGLWRVFTDTFNVTEANKTYFIDFTIQNGFVLNTVHPTDPYLPMWTVQTDASGNVTSQTDARGLMGFVKFRSEIQGIVTDQLIVDEAHIGDDSVSTVKVQDKAITEPKQADESVSTRTIQPNAVTELKMADDSVSNRTIQAKAVGNAELADGAVDTRILSDDSVTRAQIAPKAVGEAEIDENTITDSMVKGPITERKLSLDHPTTDLYNRVVNIVAGAGESNTEILDARYNTLRNKTYAVLKDRLDEYDVDFMDFGVNPKWYNASGSDQSTTGSLQIGSNNASVSSVIDFKEGQGIRFNGKPSVVTLTVTGGATAAGTLQLVLNKYTHKILLAATDNTPDLVAAKIRAAFIEGWTTSGSGAIVVFTMTGNGVATAPSINEAGTGVTGTIAITTQGVNNFITSITNIAGTSLTLQDPAPSAYDNAQIYHDDTKAIQATIDASVGKITYLPAGKHFISDTLKLPSNTTLYLSEHAVIELVPGTQKYMIVNSDQVNGNENITVLGGGKLHGNGVTICRDYTTNYWGFGCFFVKVDGLKVSDLFIQETRAWGIGHFGCSNISFRNIDFDQIELDGKNGDGITGASMNNAFFDNISGYTNDDLVAVGGGTNMPNVPVTDSKNIIINNIRPRKKGQLNAWRAVGIYATAGRKLSNVLVNNVNGDTMGCAVYVANYDPTAGAGSMDNIHINDVICNQTTATPATGIIVMQDVTIGSIKITNTSRVEDTYNYAQIYNNRCTIDSLIVENVQIAWKNGASAQVIFDAGSLKKLSLNGISALDDAGNRKNVYQKNSQDAATVTRISATNIHTGGTSGEHVILTAGKIAVNSTELNVYNYRNTPNKEDVVADPTNGLMQYDGTNWVPLQSNRGYVTTASAGTGGQWTKIASVNLSASNKRAQALLSILGGNNGDVPSNLAAQRGLVFFRVQQQNAMGGQPNIELVLMDNQRMTSEDLKAVISQNDATATVVDLYVRIVGIFELLSINVLQTGGTDMPIFYNTTGISPDLPAGVQVSATGQIVQQNSIPTVIVGTNGAYATSAVVKPVGARAAILLQKIKLIYGGSFGGSETITVEVKAVYADGTNALVTPTGTALGNSWLSDDLLDTLIPNGKQITQVELRAKSNLATSSVTVAAKVIGVGI